MLNSGKIFRAWRDKKKNILTLVLSEKKILNETKNHNNPPLPPPPSLQAKWTVPNEFFKVFDSFVENQKYGLKFMELSSSAKLQFLIGDIGYAFTNEFGIFYDVHGKMFLNECFKLRSEILNDLS